MKNGGLQLPKICTDRNLLWNRKWNIWSFGGSVKFGIFLWSGTWHHAVEGLWFLMTENVKFWSRREMPTRWNIHSNTHSRRSVRCTRLFSEIIHVLANKMLCHDDFTNISGIQSVVSVNMRKVFLKDLATNKKKLLGLLLLLIHLKKCFHLGFFIFSL